MSSEYYYFAYGSNMSVEQMKIRCKKRNFNVVGPAFIEGYSLAFTRKSKNWEGGVADLILSDESTWGVLHKVNDYALNKLDENEGFCKSISKESCFYIRRRIKVKSVDILEVEAHCYFANREEDFIQPSKKYLDTLIKGAEENGLPQEAIENIRIKGKYDQAI